MKNLIVLILIFVNANISFSQNDALISEKEPGEILWYNYLTGSATKGSNPVLTPEENIIWVEYKSAGTLHSDIHCFNPEGDTIWSKHFFARLGFDPMVIPQLGWIIIGSSSSYKKLYCLNSDGTERWNTTMSDKSTQAPVIDSLFNIYIAAGTKLISYDSAGIFRWEYNSQVGEISTPLSVCKEGVIYFGTEFDKLVAVQSTGNPIFINDLFGYVRGAPTIDNDGTIFMSTSNVDINKSKIEVFNPDGNFVWEMSLYEPNPSAIIIGGNNYIYVRTMNFWGGGYGKLYKIDKAAQSIVWSFSYGPGVEGAWDPTLSINGTIYLSVAKKYSGSAAKYYAIDENGNVIWELDPEAATGKEMNIRSHMVIGKNGNIYAMAKNDNDSNYLVAIEDPEAIIANSAWPMHKHDQHYSSLASNVVSPQPDIFVDKMALDFGFIEPGNSSNDLLTIYNIGNIPLELDWNLDSDVFNLEIIPEKASIKYKSETIQPGDSILFNVIFSPIGTAMYSDTAFFLSNDPDQPNVEVILKGKSSIEGEIKWRLQLSPHLSGPALDDFGNIYVTGSYKVWCISPNGEIKWEYEPADEKSRSDYSNITISNDNQYVFMPWGKTIIAIDSSGNEEWIFDPPEDDRLYPIAINKAGQLFFSESSMYGGGHLYCIDERGTELWNYYSGFSLSYPPAIEMNGNIITEGNSGSQARIYSIGYLGNFIWQTNFFPTSPASIGFDNMIYIGGMWGSMGNYLPKVRSYNQSGILNWEYPISNEFATVSSSIVTHPDQMLIFASSDFIYDNGTIYAIDKDGNYLWEKLYNGEIYSTPAIAKNGSICFGCNDGNFYVIHPDGSEKWNIETESEFATSPVIDKNGIIYFSTENDFLYAVYGENGGLANSPWPMVQHDAKHTSAADTSTVFIDEPEILSVKLKQMSAKPNPFNHKILIQWKINKPGEYKIIIFDLSGNEIVSHEGNCNKGINQYVWNGLNQEGNEVNSGVYICQLLSGLKTSCIKLIKK